MQRIGVQEISELDFDIMWTTICTTLGLNVNMYPIQICILAERGPAYDVYYICCAVKGFPHRIILALELVSQTPRCGTLLYTINRISAGDATKY